MSTPNIGELKKLSSNLTILYVEDEKEVQSEVSSYLSKFFKSVTAAANGLEGLELYKNNKFDIVLTDIKMPEMDGIEMSHKIKEINPNQDIIVLSAYTESEYLLSFIKLGVSDYIIKPVDYTQMNETLYKTALKITKFRENEIYHKNLEYLVKKKTDENIENYKKTLISLVKLIEERDTYTAGHSQRVAKYSVLLAKQMGYGPKERKKLYQAGILHDIGKVSTPDSILLKPGRLNEIEYQISDPIPKSV
jgi:response regulator RpfG family c-di-GMP phosphodiesterase